MGALLMPWNWRSDVVGTCHWRVSAAPCPLLSTACDEGILPAGLSAWVLCRSAEGASKAPGEQASA